MSVHFKKKSSSSDSEIPTASLADVVFVLLLFFMVTTTLRKTDMKVKVYYTHADNIEKISQKNLLSYIYVGPRTGGTKGKETRNAGIQINNSIVSMNDISSIMHKKYVDQPRLIVSIRMDKHTKTGVLIDIQKQLQDAGALRINYSAKPKDNNNQATP
jgi:biopolymer transport protein ExbD